MRGNHKRLLQCLTITGTMLAAWMALAAPAGIANPSRMRVGLATRLPRTARFTSALASQRRLRLTIALRPRNAAALQSFATAVSTPGTAQYHHYLTVSQFARRFGATSASIVEVSRALRADGLQVSAPTANDLTLSVRGTAQAAERAFAVSESHVRLADGRIAYTNVQAPTLPVGIAGDVQGVIGLDTVAREAPMSLVRDRNPAHHLQAADRHAHVATGGPVPSCAGALAHQAPNGTGNGLGYTADQIASAYKLSNFYLGGDTGAGQTVGLVEFHPFDPQDVSAYQSCYGTNAPVSVVNIDGGPGAYGSSGETDDSEPALDIEQVTSAAPGASIIVYQAPNSAAGDVDTYTQIVTADQAKVISVSYGSCEPNQTAGGGAALHSENTLFQEAATQGQSIFVSTGDQGSEACYNASAQTPNTSYAVNDAASQPFATAVGGTSLFSGTDTPQAAQYYTPGSTAEEGVWNDGNGSGTGGGLSTQWAMPSYQSQAASSVGVINSASIQNGISCGSTYCREVPDVSADADAQTGYVFNVNMNNGGGWTVIGGTSAAAPLWAAFTALVNAQPACRGKTVGFANPDLYSLAGSSYRTDFSDIVDASPITGYTTNDVLNGTGLYPVTPNYDMATGIGSMVTPGLAPALCALASPVYSVAVTSPGSQSSFVGTPVSLTVAGTDSGGAALHYAASGLPAGLAMATNGVITGTPTTAQTATVTVSAADGFTNTGSTSFTWSIVNRPPPPVVIGKPTAQSVTLSGLGKRKPKLTLTLAAGTNAPPLTAASILLPNGLKFATKAKTLDKGISLKSGKTKLKFAVSVKKGVLTLTFKSSTRSATLTLTKPAVTITASEATKIRKHKVKKLTIGLKTINTSKQTVNLTITLKKLS